MYERKQASKQERTNKHGSCIFSCIFFHIIMQVTKFPESKIIARWLLLQEIPLVAPNPNLCTDFVEMQKVTSYNNNIYPSCSPKGLSFWIPNKLNKPSSKGTNCAAQSFFSHPKHDKERTLGHFLGSFFVLSRTECQQKTHEIEIEKIIIHTMLTTIYVLVFFQFVPPFSCFQVFHPFVQCHLTCQSHQMLLTMFSSLPPFCLVPSNLSITPNASHDIPSSLCICLSSTWASPSCQIYQLCFDS